MKRQSIYSKSFLFIAIGQIISIFGNQILRYALPLYLLKETGSSAIFGTISAFSLLPMLVLFPIGGIIADRLNKKNIMVFLDFGTSFLIFIFYVLENRINIIPLIAVMMLLLYAIQGVYQPTVKASIPILVGDENILRANSIVDVIDSSASMIGPVLGGVIFAKFGLNPILYISMISFFISAIMELFIELPFEKEDTKDNLFIIGLNDLRESFQFIFIKQPILWKVSLVFASINFLLTALVLISGPVLITQQLNFSVAEADRLYGYSQGVIASGAVFGGLLAGVLSNRLTAKMSPLLLFGSGLSIVISGIGWHILSNSRMIYAFMVFGFGMLMVLSTLFQLQLMSYIQLLTSNNLIGKVISTVVLINMSASPLGQLIYGHVFNQLESNFYLPFYIAGSLVLLLSILTKNMFYRIYEEIEEVKLASSLQKK